MKKNEQLKPLQPKHGGFAFSALMIAYVLFSFFGSVILEAIFGKGKAYNFTISVLPALSIILVLLVFRFYLKLNIFGLQKREKFNPIIIVLILTASIGMLFGLGFINTLFTNLFNWLGVIFPQSNIEIQNFGEFLLYALTLALMPAVFEELIFRGVMLNSLESVSLLKRVLFTAILFSLYHCSPEKLVYQFIYGTVLGLLTVYSKSVIPAIITHFINNFTVLLLTYLKVVVDFFNVAIIILGLIVLAVFFIVVILKLKGMDKKYSEKSSRFLLFSTFGVLLCAVLIISSFFVGG